MGAISQDLKEYFDKLELDGIKLSDPQKWWYAAKREILGEEIFREYPSFPEEAFQASQEGYWYASYIKELHDAGHVTNVSYDRALPMHSAWDLGQADSTSIWFFQVNRSGDINICDFWQKNNTPLDQICILLKSKNYNYGKHIWPHDAAARDRSGITFVQQAASLGLQGMVLEPHGFLQGVNLVKTTLSKCWFDQTKCAEGLKLLENYKKRWSSSFGGWTSEPVHDNCSHACFIGETLVMTDRGERTIDSIKIGDQVMTPFGYKKVKNIFEYPAPTPMLTIVTTNREFTCTTNHKIFTKNRLAYADTLRYNYDELYAIGDVSCLNGFSSKAQGIGFRDLFLSAKMNQSYGMTEESTNGTGFTTNEPSPKNAHSPVYTEPCILATLEKFPKECIYTIRITIDVIMRLKTYCQSLKANIANFITQKKEESSQENRSKKPFCTQKSGINLQMEESGIQLMQSKENSLNSPKESLSVNSVEMSLKPERRVQSDSVQINAKLDGAICQESTTKSEIAPCVGKNSPATDTSKKERVVNVVMFSPQRDQKVYDIEVEDDHCYYANGILVSNSDAFRYMCAGIEKITGASAPLGQQMDILRKFWG